jgi:hypothetical protein
MRVYVAGIGLAAPGLPGWAASVAVLAGSAAYVPAPAVITPSQLLPAAERRRASLPVKLALAVGQEAFAHAAIDAATTATVFTSSGGDGENIHRICETLASPEREISPTRFHNSVHNAPAGYWSIATHAREASTSLAGHDASFAAGLLDATAQVSVDGVAVALIAHDSPYFEPLNGLRTIAAPFGVALVLTPAPGPHDVAMLDVEFAGQPAAPDTMADAALEALRTGIPAARSLPLLAALARGREAALVIPYQAHNHLRVRVMPC